MVVLTVGTDEHPFDRAVRWVDAWAAANPGTRVVVQRGPADPPAHAEGDRLLPRPALDAVLREATAVVCHAGPATIHQVRLAGRLPLCIARDPELGEHTDDRQLRFAAHQAAHGRVLQAASESELHDLLDRVRTDPEAFVIDPWHDTDRLARAVTRAGRFIDALLDRDEARLDLLHDEALVTDRAG